MAKIDFIVCPADDPGDYEIARRKISQREYMSDGDYADMICDELKYWISRCEAAETYIHFSPCDPDITDDQCEAYAKWNESKIAQ